MSAIESPDFLPGYYDDHGWYVKPSPTPVRRARDVEKLNEFVTRAEEIKAKVEALTKEFAIEFGTFAQTELSNYEYDGQINGLVYNVMEKANINEYQYEGFWLPSNIGC